MFQIGCSEACQLIFTNSLPESPLKARLPYLGAENEIFAGIKMIMYSK